MKRSRIAIWTLVVLVVFLTFTNLYLKLKYEVDFFGTEKFIHQDNSMDTFEFHWPEDKKMALSLTFDDGQQSQIDSGIPILDKYGIKATFYLLPGEGLEAWKDVPKNGHEIGNHTYHHPCSTNYDFTSANSLENYTMTRMFNDLNLENEIFKKVLGVHPVSFAYPCGQTFIGKGAHTQSYVPLISKMFESGRLYSGGTVNPVFCDLSQLPSENIDNVSFDKIRKLIDDAKDTGKWLILTGHSIGLVNNNLTTSTITLEKICMYAKDPANGIWIDNVHNITSYIKEQRNEKPFKYLSIYKTPTSSVYAKLVSVYYIWRMKLARLQHKFSHK